MRTIQIRIVIRMLANKVSEKIILERVSGGEELFTRKVREKYLSIRIRMERILSLKIYLRSNILITKS